MKIFLTKYDHMKLLEKRLVSKKYMNKLDITNVKKHLDKHLTKDTKQNLINISQAIHTNISGDGSGLTSGFLIEKCFIETLKKNVPEFEQYNVGESDYRVLGYPMSFKKISGKSKLALNWSKNANESTRENFDVNLFILNLKSEVWWKTKSLGRNEVIPRGIYLIDKYYCKENVKIKSNNKTNTLVNSHCLYSMLQHSLQSGLFISLPECDQEGVIEWGNLVRF